jgi:hypothetical protein
MNIKKANQLQAGDVIETSGRVKITITKVSPGMIRGALLISWKNGWSHIAKKDSIQIFN